MMTYRLPATLALALGLAVGACSDNGAASSEAEAPATTAEAPVGADDDTLEPEAPVVEEGEEHNEDAPHSH